MARDLILQQPAGTPAQLFLLYHGVGSEPEQMAALGERLAGAFPHSQVVSVAAPVASDLGAGWQWFSIQGVTEENRPARVAAALPAFRGSIAQWQRRTGLGPTHTALIGFSQGGIMALEATRGGDFVAGRIVALGARFAVAPTAPARETTLHLIHGETDAMIPSAQTLFAAERLAALEADYTADVLPTVGHEVHADMIALVITRLQNHIPRHLRDAALAAAPAVVPRS
jgi:phospholipase/carboxylesterase